MDRIDRIGQKSPSPEFDDDTFQQTLSRLTLHLATRQPAAALPSPAPARKRPSRAWPLLALIAIPGAVIAGYHVDLFTGGQDLLQAATPRVAAAEAATVSQPAATPAAAVPARVEQPPNAPDLEAAVRSQIPMPPPPPPPPMSETAPAPDIALTWSEVLEVQKCLAALGLEPGPLDGVAGPRTTASVQRYEEQKRRPVTGKVDRRLLEALRQDASSAKLEATAP